MARQSHLDPSGFDLPGGPVGVLLIHGFTGAPTEMRLMAEYLHARGMTVSAPRRCYPATARRWRI